MIEANLRNISSEMRFRHWHENPTELCEITLKVVHSFSQQEAGWLVPLAQRSGLSGVRKAALQDALPSSLPLSWVATRLASQAYGSLQSVHFKHMNITEKEINAIWFKCQFLQDPDISDTNH